jgi:hypothetical protein
MRLLVLGVDADGRSCIVEDNDAAPVAVDGVPGVSISSLFRTTQSPPPPCPPGLGTLLEDRLPPGCVHWYVVDHEPPDGPEEHAGTELHRRNTIDLIVMLEGDAELILGDGSHPVHAGDCIVMAGIDHGLRTGPNGCRMMSFAIGTPPAAS